MALAVSELILLIGTGVLGWMGEQGFRDRHILLAVLGTVLSCLIQAVVFTYFTATGKMMGQAIHLGRLSDDEFREIRTIKQCAARSVALVLVALLASAATGARVWRNGDWRTVHLVFAATVVIAHSIAYSRQLLLIHRNAQLVGRVMNAYTGGRQRLGAAPSAGQTVHGEIPQ